MKPVVSSKEKKRSIVTFEAEKDVYDLIEKAKMNGLTQVEILNEAMRDCGLRVIKDLAARRRAKLEALTFNQPDLQLGGYSIAA